MNDIKFSCPACGQKIKCDSGHAGARIPCPGCGQELEIPRAEVKPATAEASPAPSDAESETGAGLPGSAKVRGDKRSPGESSVSSRPPVRSPSTVAAEEDVELRCLCPVCRSELKVKKPGKQGVPTGTLPLAELVRPGSTGRFTPPAPQAEAPPEKAKTPASASTTASAAAGRPVTERASPPGVGAKPRLSYVLTGQPPAPLPRPDGTPRRKGTGQKPPSSSLGSGQTGKAESAGDRG